MSKYLKSLITALLVVCMTVCLGVLAVACTDKPDDSDDKDSNKGTFPSSVSITVMLDETTPAVGVKVQLCALNDDGSLKLCLDDVATNDKGIATIPVKESTGKNYEVHLTNLDKVYDDGYQYVDANDTPYAEGKGIHIDVTKTSKLTITLKAKPAPVVTEHDIAIDTETTALVGHSYVFTAPEEGYYLFTCDVEMSGGWSLNDETQWGNNATIQLDKDATATIAVSYNCTIKVENGEAPAVGTEDNPLALTLGTEANFSVNLEERIDRWGQPDEDGNMPTILAWKDNYRVTFTTTTAGSYKVTITLPDMNDDVSPTIHPKNSSLATPDDPAIDFEFDSPVLYFTFSDLLADTEYIMTFSSNVDDYTEVAGEATSLSYTVKVEYVENDGNGGNGNEDDVEPIETWEMTNFPKDEESATVKTLNVETAGTYKFNVSDFACSDPDVSVSILESETYTFIIDGNKYTTEFMSTDVNVALTTGEHTVKFYIARKVVFDFSAKVTVTETTEPAADPDPVLNVGDTQVSLKIDSVTTYIVSKDYTFTATEGGTYTLTVTGDDLAHIFISATRTPCIDPDEELESYEFTLEAGQSIVFTCDSYQTEDTTYTVHIEKNVESGTEE